MQKENRNGIFLITGVMAVGKSTIAQMLAEKFEKSVHLRGDAFRKMIVNGREEMLPETSQESVRQLSLRHEIAASTADRYYRAGFTVVLQDVIIGSFLAETVTRIQSRPLYVIVLAPRPEAVMEREKSRPKTGYGLWTADELDRRLREETPKIGLWLDTTNQTAAQTLDEIWGRVWAQGIIEETDSPY
ncbi:AAA family ATPase [Brevibacillus borstelensis]|uniref:AAA family ATPase n=1 Tax=Brevibacillus borstelensis TaxID=45462 RepID=UPI001D0B94C0|nr:AAA family ATPase [Brevibacillus borstelensis]MCC0565745.1 AAA family ATPase [Brevibacillus borstelensis]